MKKIFFGIFLFLYISAHAATTDSMFIIGADYKLLHISNDHNAGYLYAENYQHQKILIYQSNSPYPSNSSFIANQIEGTDILGIFFSCNKKSCTRLLNRRTNKLSAIYSDILDYNAKNDVVAYYLQDKNIVMISRAFKTCNKPLTYLVKIDRDSYFGIKTKFLSSGGLQLDYEDTSGEDVIKIIHPNYKKLFSDCGG